MCGPDPEAYARSAACRAMSELNLGGLAKRALRARRVWEGLRQELLPQVAAWAAAGSERWCPDRSPALANNPCWRQMWLEVDSARPCANLGCTNVSGASEERLVACSRRCGGCRRVSYCSVACRDAAWPEHSLVCGRQEALAQDLAADVARATGAGAQGAAAALAALAGPAVQGA